MNKNISDLEILRLWRDINFSGSYRGVKTFQILLKTDLNIDIPESRLYKVLKQDHIFLIHSRPKRNFDRRHFDLNYYGELVQADLAYMFEFDGYKYFLVLIDCYTNKIVAKAIKDKSSSSVFACFETLKKELNCDITKLETDQGKEFSSIKQFCKQHNIIFKYKFGQNKARYIQFDIDILYFNKKNFQCIK